WLIICPTASSSTFFDPLIYFRCSFSFRHKNTPLDNHIQRGETSQLFYKHRDFVLNIASFLQTSRLYFKPTTDDYVVKPFEPKELVYRVKTLFRLYNIQTEDELTIGSIKINKKTYVVHIDEQSFILPLKEFELLFFLASHPSQVFSRIHLIEHIWGFDYEGDERTVDVHIKRLRERFSKITNDFRIKTVRGIGYSLEVNE